MKGTKNTAMVMVGVLVGSMLTGPAAHAAESYLKAYHSAQAIYLDGQQVELEAYTINGSNYVKLRDIGEAVGFNVYWDGAVQIDSDAPYTGVAPEAKVETEISTPAPVTLPITEDGPYTINAGHWSREDYSQAANPAVFTGVYDRALYNAIRQTLVDEGRQGESSCRYAYTMVGDGEYNSVKELLGRMDGALRYEHHVPQNLANYYEYLDYFAVSVETPENYRDALDFIRPVIQEASRLGTDEEKVTLLNGYLKTLLTYDSRATAGITQTFAPHDGELKAACGSYARAFKVLCSAAGIPCISISTDIHTWNLVYADGQWLHVDVSSNDQMVRDSILLEKSLPSRTDRAPEATEFLKELLVPGSTR